MEVEFEKWYRCTETRTRHATIFKPKSWNGEKYQGEIFFFSKGCRIQYRPATIRGISNGGMESYKRTSAAFVSKIRRAWIIQEL